MIHINEGQAQLSGWGYAAEPEALFINKVPEPFMVGQTISAAATRGIGGTELHFSDGTILYYHQGYGLFPALENVTVWTVPAEGTTVSNTLEYVEINASYTTKSGKVIKAIPVKVPVAVPKFLRVIVPEEPLIDEGIYANVWPGYWEDQIHDGRQLRGIKSACHIKGVRFFVYWADSQDTIIKVSEVFEPENDTIVKSSPFHNNYAPFYEIEMEERTSSATFTRYRSESDGGVQITLENAARFVFSYKVGNIRLEHETYFQTNPIVSWGYYKMPTSYTGTEQVTLKIEEHTKVTYKDGKVRIGKYFEGGNFILNVWMRYKVVGGWWETRGENTITLADGRTGLIDQYALFTYKEGSYGQIVKVSNKRKYTCADGEVTWTNEPA